MLLTEYVQILIGRVPNLRHRGVFLLSVLIWGHAGQLSATVCETLYRTLQFSKRLTVKTGYHAAKTTFYVPVVLPVKAIRERNVRFLAKDKWNLMGYFALAALQRTTGLTYNQFQNATSDFDEETDDELRVVIDGFSGNDPIYGGAGNYIYRLIQRRHKKGHLEFVHLENKEQLIKALEEIVKRTGKKISRFDYYGHGLPGMLESLSFESDSWFSSYTKDGEFEVKTTSDEFSPLFASEAKMRFNACFSVNGQAGKMFVNEVFGTALRETGGEVLGSKVQILPNAVELTALWVNASEPPKWLRAYGDWLSAYNGVVTLGTGLQMQYEGFSREMPFHLSTSERFTLPTPTREQKENWNKREDLTGSLTDRLNEMKKTLVELSVADFSDEEKRRQALIKRNELRKELEAVVAKDKRKLETYLETMTKEGKLSKTDAAYEEVRFQKLEKDLFYQLDKGYARISGLYSSTDDKIWKSDRDASNATEKAITSEVLKMLGEDNHNFWILNGRIVIVRKEEEKRKKIFSVFPESKGDKGLIGISDAIEIVPNPELKAILRKPILEIYEMRKQEILMAIETEKEQNQRLLQEKLITPMEQTARLEELEVLQKNAERRNRWNFLVE